MQRAFKYKYKKSRYYRNIISKENKYIILQWIISTIILHIT